MLSGLSFNLSLFSKYRTEIMGIAAIMIIIGHAEGNGVLMPWMMTKIIIQGGLGVDIFLFLSGMGLYYSLTSHIAVQWRGGGFGM